jgi:diaminopimelate decarboxylase
LNGQLLVEAAERWGTPLYVTDLDRATANARAWTGALPGALVAYAVKANPDPALLRRLAAEGIGAEVVGPVELALALRAGVAPERIVVNGVGQADADLRDALGSGALVNAESLGALDAVLEAPAPGRIGLRVNPALDAETHPHLATGAAGSKFGIALEEVNEALDRVRRAGRRLTSIGAHIGSAIAEAAPFAQLAALVAGLAERAEVGTVDLGGGFAGDPVAWADAVRPALGTHRLIVEPGRGIVGDAGWLLTRVVRVQARGHLVVDAGMTELIRPMLYGAEHPVSLLVPGDPLADRDGWTLSGPVCEAGDILARGVDLGPGAGEGALLAIGQAGAYGVAMSSNYNGRLRPAQAVIEGGEPRLSVRRETLEDLVARDVPSRGDAAF